jgi:hypothetical protein
VSRAGGAEPFIALASAPCPLRFSKNLCR